MAVDSGMDVERVGSIAQQLGYGLEAVRGLREATLSLRRLRPTYANDGPPLLRARASTDPPTGAGAPGRP